MTLTEYSSAVAAGVALAERCDSTDFLGGAALPPEIQSDVNAAFVEACGLGG